MAVAVVAVVVVAVAVAVPVALGSKVARKSYASSKSASSARLPDIRFGEPGSKRQRHNSKKEELQQNQELNPTRTDRRLYTKRFDSSEIRSEIRTHASMGHGLYRIKCSNLAGPRVNHSAIRPI